MTATLFLKLAGNTVDGLATGRLNGAGQSSQSPEGKDFSQFFKERMAGSGGSPSQVSEEALQRVLSALERGIELPLDGSDLPPELADLESADLARIIQHLRELEAAAPGLFVDGRGEGITAVGGSPAGAGAEGGARGEGAIAGTGANTANAEGALGSMLAGAGLGDAGASTVNAAAVGSAGAEGEGGKGALLASIAGTDAAGSRSASGGTESTLQSAADPLRGGNLAAVQWRPHSDSASDPTTGRIPGLGPQGDGSAYEQRLAPQSSSARTENSGALSGALSGAPTVMVESDGEVNPSANVSRLWEELRLINAGGGDNQTRQSALEAAVGRVSTTTGGGETTGSQTSAASLSNLSSTPTPQSGAAPTAPVTVAGPDWSNALAQRVGWMLEGRMGRADIALDPPELGPLQVRIHTQNDQTQVQFVSANSQVREALDQALPRLREMLESQGLQLVEADVRDQTREGGDGREAAPWAADAVTNEGSSPVEEDRSMLPGQPLQGLVDAYA